MKTKGALIWEFNQPWSVEEIEIGDPRKDEVKIQMEAAGMCHSDHHLVTGGIPMAGFPVLGGHEGAGIVTEVGQASRTSPRVTTWCCRSSRRAANVNRVRRECVTCATSVPDCSTVPRSPTARSASRPAARTSTR
ncbi:alcohol dehydrogenase GroES-like domain protein [Mycobacterium xenopi 4042]|uniref:alcohol dehydrogenase n=1 Tax=Mycobacterium xenopi 4042 TaxID=1299334 RepID=X7ZV67_MYCXE|nr:alcohol dehydrogenase GroES-like domain protein [Mycobacterium xenopi 4042]